MPLLGIDRFSGEKPSNTHRFANLNQEIERIVPTRFRRIANAIGANTFGQIVTIAIQLASLPLFLHYWPVDEYGSWLVVSSIPTYLSLTEFGVCLIAGNAALHSLERGDIYEAEQTIHSAALFTVTVCIAVALLSALASFAVVGLNIFTPALVGATGLLTASVMLVLAYGPVEALTRASGRYSLSIYVTNLGRLLEWVGQIVGLIALNTFIGVALGGLLGRVIHLVVATKIANTNSYNIKAKTTLATWQRVRAMLRPSMDYMYLPVANAITFQGMTMAVAALGGSSAVAIFNTYRTIARINVQLTGIFSHSLAGEFGSLFGRGNHAELNKLRKKASLYGFWIAILASILIVLIGPIFLDVWSSGRISYSFTLMLAFCAYAAAASAWHVSRISLISTNRAGTISPLVLVSSLLTIVVYCSGIFGYSPLAASISMTISELVIAVVTIRIAQRDVA